MADVKIALRRYNVNVYDRLLPVTAWDYIEDKPATYPPTSHTHSYISTSHPAEGVTTTLISDWNAAKTHADSPHAPSNATAAGATGDAHAATTHAPTNADNTALNETSHSDVVVDEDVTTTNTVNKIVKRDGNGYVFATIFNSTFSSNNTNVGHIMTKNTTDGYIRPTTLASFKTALGSMPASDVYSWAKASTKPSYTYTEVGALASTKAAIEALLTGEISTHEHSKINYVTTCPIANNTDGLGFYVGSTDCATKYSGWVYLVTE